MAEERIPRIERWAGSPENSNGVLRIPMFKSDTSDSSLTSLDGQQIKELLVQSGRYIYLFMGDYTDKFEKDPTAKEYFFYGSNENNQQTRFVAVIGNEEGPGKDFVSCDSTLKE